MSKEPKEPEELQESELLDSYLNLISSAKSRLLKGFLFEKLVYKTLDELSVPYIGNPKEYHQWLRYVSKGYDLIIYGVKIELKYNSPKTNIYRSYLLRDWISREALIIVVNNDNPVRNNKGLLRLLKKHGKKLMSLTQFLKWVKRKLRFRKKSSHNRVTRHILSLNRSVVSLYILERVLECVLVSNLFFKEGFSPPFKAFCSKFLNLISSLHKSLSKLSKTIGGIIVKMRLEEFFEKFMAQSWKKYRHLKLREAKEKREELVTLWRKLRRQKSIQLKLGESRIEELSKRKLELLKIKAKIYALNKLIQWRQYQMMIMSSKT